MIKKFIIMLMFLFILNGVYANSFISNPVDIYQNFVDIVTANNSSVMDYITYIIAPFLLMFLILKSIMEEIEFFRNTSRKIQNAIPLLLAIISMPAIIRSGLIVKVVSMGNMVAFGIFSTLFFVYGLSHYYRKKYKEYGFVLGSPSLSLLIIHAPLLIIGTIMGWFVRDFIVYPWTLFIPVTVIAIFIIMLLFNKNLKAIKIDIENHLWVVGVIVGALALLFIFPNDWTFLNDLRGPIVGFSIALLYAILISGRHSTMKDIKSIVAEENARVSNLQKRLRIFEKALDTLSSERPSRNNMYYFSRLSNDEKKVLLDTGIITEAHIELGMTESEYAKALDKLNEKIRVEKSHIYDIMHKAQDIIEEKINKD